MRSFKQIYEIAALHKGGVKVLEASLPLVLSDDELCSIPDNYYLSKMSQRVFRAGLKHALVDAKWPHFEKVFHQFDSFYCAMLSDDDIDEVMGDKSLIRHLGKIKSIRTNAQFIRAQSNEHGGFGKFVAKWQSHELVQLWTSLKKQGAHLGGRSGAQFLRMVGKDTILLSDDVVGVLKLEGVIERYPTSLRDQKAAHGAFMIWQQECGRPLCEISRIVSCAAL